MKQTIFLIIFMLVPVIINSDPSIRIEYKNGKIIQGELIRYEKGVFEIMIEGRILVVLDEEVACFSSVVQNSNIIKNKGERRISFDFPNPVTGKLLTACQVLVDGKPITPQDFFPTNRNYNLTAKFKGYSTVQKEIFLNSGEGDYVESLSPTPLESYKFQWMGDDRISFDSMTYNMEILADNVEVEPHQISSETFPNYTYVQFYIPQNTRNVDIYMGFYLCQKPPSLIHGKQRAEKIDAERLLKHLKRIDPYKALARLSNVISAESRLLKKTDRDDLEELIHYVEGMESINLGKEAENTRETLLRALINLR